MDYRAKAIGQPSNCLNFTYNSTSALSLAFSMLNHVLHSDGRARLILQIQGRASAKPMEGGKPLPRCPSLCYFPSYVFPDSYLTFLESTE